MAEIDFILSRSEQLQMIEGILAEGIIFVPYLRYGQPKHTKLTQAEEIYEVACSPEVCGPFFLTAPQFSRYPLEMEAVEWQGEQRYFLRQRYGGPYLDLSVSCMKDDITPPLLLSGFIAFYRSYFFGESPTELPAPQELRDLYNFLAKWLRDSCKKVTTISGNRRYWVGDQAYTELSSGLRTNVNGIRLGSLGE